MNVSVRAIAGPFLVGVALLGTPADAVAERTGDPRSHCDGKPATILVDHDVRRARGTHRADVIGGTPRGDRIAGRGRNDRMCGKGGGDVLRDGPGADRVRGGRGRDRIRGGRGRDRLFGGAGRDRLQAADGAPDRVRAGKGRDEVRSRDGARDAIDCGPGRDTARVDDLDVLKSCERAVVSGQPAFSLPSWSDGTWSDPDNYETVQTGDLDGDGDEELFGRSAIGIEAQSFDEGTGQWLPMPTFTGPDAPSDDEGWAQPQYYSTIQAADLDGDGADEIFGRSDTGIAAWKLAGGQWETLPPLGGPQAPSDQNDWNQEPYYRTIGAADVDGDGAEEVFGRGSGGVLVWKYQPGAQTWVNLPSIVPPVGHSPSDAAGWAHPRMYLTMQAADLDGDGADEIFGRDDAGLRAWRFNSGANQWQELPPMQGPASPCTLDCPPTEWDLPQYYTTIHSGDLDGDGAHEVFGRGSQGIQAWKFRSSHGEWEVLPSLTGKDAPSDVQGWAQPQFYLTIQAGDIDGDGADEVLGRSSGGVIPWALRSGEWSELQVEGDLSDGNGWNRPRYYETIQTARVDDRGDVLLGRWLTGIQGYRYDASAQRWRTASAEFPQFPPGEEARAYQAINEALGVGIGPPYTSCPKGSNQGFDIRNEYSTAEEGTLNRWLGCVNAMPQPEGVSEDVWNKVRGQIVDELTNAATVANWFEVYMNDFIDDVFIIQSLDDSAGVLEYDVNSNAELEMEQWEVLEGILEGLNVFDVGEIGEGAVVVNSLLGGAASAGMGVAPVDQAIDGIQGDYLKLRQELDGTFEAAVDGNSDAEVDILGDYGLQSVVGELIGSGGWVPLVGTSRAAAVAGAARNYAVGAWQTITPDIWIAYRIPSSVSDFWCAGGACDWNNDGSWQLSYPPGSFAPDCRSDSTDPAQGPCKAVSSGLRAQLFGSTSSGCQQSSDGKEWIDGCNMGVPYSDVFLGQNGWQNLPMRYCTYDEGLFCPRQR